MSNRRTSVLLALTGILLMALDLRAGITSITPLIDRMNDDLAFTPAMIGLLGSLAPLAFAASGLVGAALMRRLSGERIAVLLLVVMVVGQVLRLWMPAAALFLVVSAVLLLAMGVGNVIIPALVKAWFPQRIGLVTALYTTMLAVGTAVPALVAIPLADAAPGLDWRLGVGIWAVIAVLAIPSWVVVARQPRALPRGEVQARLPVHRSRIAWGLGLIFITNSLNLYSMFTWLPIRLTDAGLSPAAAGAQLAVFAGIGIVPSLLLPAVAARMERTFGLVVLCVVCFLVGYAGLLWAPTTATTLWTVIGGLGGGGFPLVLTLIGLRSATPATAGAVSAFAQTVGYCGAVTGPLLFGVLHEAVGGWSASFAFLGVTMVLMLIGGLLTNSPRTVDAELLTRDARENHWSQADTLAR